MGVEDVFPGLGLVEAGVDDGETRQRLVNQDILLERQPCQPRLLFVREMFAGPLCGHCGVWVEAKERLASTGYCIMVPHNHAEQVQSTHNLHAFMGVGVVAYNIP